MSEASDISLPDKATLPDQLPPVEKRKKLFGEATAIRDRFVQWVDKKIPGGIIVEDFGEEKRPFGLQYIADQIKQSPSKEFLKKTIGIVGLYDIGLTIAASKLGVPNEVLPILWSSTFFYPVWEELRDRSKFIPSLATEVAKKMGMQLPDNNARIVADATFWLGHFPNLDPKKFFAGAYLTKVAHEKGLAGSIASHSLINAAILGLGYLNKGAEKIFPGNADIARNALTATAVSGLVAVGAMGVKELFDDRNIQQTLQQLKSTDTLNSSLQIPKIKELTHDLLSKSSRKGYKFLAGVELSYTTAFLESQEFIHQPEMRTAYALEQVSHAIQKASKSPAEIEEKQKVAIGFLQTVVQNAN